MAATITLTATSFVPNNGNPPSVSLCGLQTPPVLSGNDTQVSLDGNNIKVNPSNKTGGPNGKAVPVGLTFTIVSPSNATLVPTKIVFIQSEGSGDADGSKDFSTAVISGASISADDNWVTHGNSSQHQRFKYYIQVRNTQATAPNDLGWIDPGIENEE